MQLSNIQQFLEVYRKRLFKAEDERNTIINSIKNISGVTLLESQIIIKKGILSIHADSITRNQLFLYKTKIIEELKKGEGIKIFNIY